VCGSSADKNIIDLAMKDKKADLLLTDPPYGVDYGEKNNFLNESDRGNRIISDIENDSADMNNLTIILKNSFNNIKKHFNKKASYYIFLALNDELFGMTADLYKAVGFPIRHLLMWAKNNHVIGRCDYFYKHEPIIYGWIDGHNFYGNGTQKTTVLEYDKPNKSKVHPTEKPVELLENLIENSTAEGDVVVDIFGGSGSTLIACENTGRRCVTVELKPEYCNYIINRWQTITEKKAYKLNGGAL
jgi:site-specific DNA-methyltransferase (adenine-specific)